MEKDAQNCVPGLPLHGLAQSTPDKLGLPHQHTAGPRPLTEAAEGSVNELHIVGSIKLIPSARGNVPDQKRWVMGDARWVMGDARWMMGDARQVIGDARLVMGDARWVMGDARWVIGDARWVIDDAK